jgi:N-acetylglutamate synthase-like GNAT family acetyltransferase
METETIVIRQAHNEDVRDIWHLLHSEGCHIHADEIAEEPERFYLMLHGTRLLGVCDNWDRGEKPRWVAVHALFPQKFIEEIMVKAVNGVFCKIFE